MVPIRIPTICWKIFSVKTTKILSYNTKNSGILMMSSSVYLLLESEYSFKKYASSRPNTRYLYLHLLFLKMKEFRIILVSLLFSLSRGIVVLSKDSMIVTWLKFGDLGSSNNSFDFLRIHIWFSRSLFIFQLLGECHCWWTSESPTQGTCSQVLRSTSIDS